MTSELDTSGWFTLDSPSPFYDPTGLGDTREWDVLIRPWGSNDVLSVGPFASWDDAETWAEYRATTTDATILGIAERRRPKGMDVAPRRRPRRAAA